MSAIVTAFNNIASQFVAELVQTFPEEQQFKVFKSGVRLLNSANKNKLIQLFIHYCINFQDQIKNKDESFFLAENYNDVIDAEDKDMITKIIDKLKVHWGTLNEENKSKVWQYMITLLELSNKYAMTCGK